MNLLLHMFISHISLTVTLVFYLQSYKHSHPNKKKKNWRKKLNKTVNHDNLLCAAVTPAGLKQIALVM